MDTLSRTLLMSVGIIQCTLSQQELDDFARAQEAAALEREQHVLDEKAGFELGWDYARFLGWHPEDETNKHFVGGYTTAKEKTAPPPHVDRYTRKWLQLRYGAWRRCRVFDENVTPAFLQLIDRPMCPILGCALTHSTGELTDWSVDRLNNHGGYAVGNLAVMSTQANAAKGNLTLDDILALSRQATPASGLSPLQWKRMASLLTGAYSIAQEEELLLPLCIVPPPFVPLNLFQEFQLVLVRETGQKKSPLLSKLEGLCPTRGTVRLFKKLVQRVATTRVEGRPSMEIWLDDSTLGCLVALYQKLPPPAMQKMRNAIERALGCEQVSVDMCSRWALENKGFA